MSAKKIVVIVLSSALALVLGFCTFWVINNYDAIEYAMSGSALYTKSDLDKAYEDGYNAAGYDVKDLNEIITGLRSDLDTKSAELKKVKSDYNNLLKNYTDHETSSKEEQTELSSQIAELNRIIVELEKEIETLNISLESYEEFKAQLEAENTVIATFVYDGSIISIQGYEKGSKIQAVEIPEDTDEIKFNGWMVNDQAINITDYTINETTVFIADLSYHYTVSFMVDDVLFSSKEVVDGTITLPEEPIKSRAVFKGWSIDGLNVLTVPLDNINSSIEYIAVFEYLDKYNSVELVCETTYLNYGSGFWLDGENIYYSNGYTHYAFDKETLVWKEKEWKGLTRFSGSSIWTDGENIYYAVGSSHRVLNKETSTWETKTWNIDVEAPNIWTDGVNVYYTTTVKSYVLDKETDTWVEKADWPHYGPLAGEHVWSDGNNLYYSNGSGQRVLNKETDAWVSKAWNGLQYFDGKDIWSDGVNIYYSTATEQYVLDKETDTWDKITWYMLDVNLYGRNVFTDGENHYFILNGNMYKFVRKDIAEERPFLNEYNSLELIDENPDVFSAYYMWSDGENNYYSYDKNHFIWNKETLSWDEISWNGLESFWGSTVWTDGENIYCTSTTKSYVLNKETSTWEEKTWNGVQYFDGSYIWSDGDNIFYSKKGETQLVLNKETDTWEEMIWGGYSDIRGSYVWTDGENYYYSEATTQLVLNKETYTWEPSSFTGKPHFHGDVVWTDGYNVYYNSYTSQCILDKETNHWEQKVWDTDVSFSAGFSSETGVWTDGVNYYLTMQYKTYKFIHK